MARVTIEDCLENVENRFQLVHMAAQRTRALIEGDQSLVVAPKNRETTVALREIAAGKVHLVEQTGSRRTSKFSRRRRRK